MIHDRRDKPRFPLLLTTYGMVRDKRFDVVCLNSGPGGGFFACKSQPNINEIAIFYLQSSIAGGAHVLARARVVRTVPRGSGGQPGFAAQWQHVGSEGGAEVVTAILRDVLFVSDAPIDQDADGSAHFTCNGYNRPRPVDEVLHSEATVHLAPAAKVAPATRASAAFAVVKQPAASVDEHASSDLGSAVESSDPFAFASFGADPDPVAAVARKPAAEEIKAPAPAAKEVGTKTRSRPTPVAVAAPEATAAPRRVFAASATEAPAATPAPAGSFGDGVEEPSAPDNSGQAAVPVAAQVAAVFAKSPSNAARAAAKQPTTPVVEAPLEETKKVAIGPTESTSRSATKKATTGKQPPTEPTELIPYRPVRRAPATPAAETVGANRADVKFAPAADLDVAAADSAPVAAFRAPAPAAPVAARSAVSFAAATRPAAAQATPSAQESHRITRNSVMRRLSQSWTPGRESGIVQSAPAGPRPRDSQQLQSVNALDDHGPLQERPTLPMQTMQANDLRSQVPDLFVDPLPAGQRRAVRTTVPPQDQLHEPTNPGFADVFPARTAAPMQPVQQQNPYASAAYNGVGPATDPGFVGEDSAQPTPTPMPPARRVPLTAIPNFAVPQMAAVAPTQARAVPQVRQEFEMEPFLYDKPRARSQAFTSATHRRSPSEHNVIVDAGVQEQLPINESTIAYTRASQPMPGRTPGRQTGTPEWPVGIPTGLSERYGNLTHVGTGGHGVVYKATDLHLGRTVVLKFMAQSAMSTEMARKYFLREVKTASILNHSNIVHIYDIGKIDDVLYYSMEFVDGQPLSAYLPPAAPINDFPFVLSMLNQICDALDHAHAQNILHRDVKPDNVLITQEGVAKLFDFGLARAADEGFGEQSVLIGTPHYMAPEQLMGGRVDHRADLYALGVLLFRVLTGSLPYATGNVFAAHAVSPIPDARQFNPNLPPAVVPVLRKLLAKRPEDRYNNGQEIAAAMYDALYGV